MSVSLQLYPVELGRSLNVLPAQCTGMAYEAPAAMDSLMTDGDVLCDMSSRRSTGLSSRFTTTTLERNVMTLRPLTTATSTTSSAGARSRCWVPIWNTYLPTRLTIRLDLTSCQPSS